MWTIRSWARTYRILWTWVRTSHCTGDQIGLRYHMIYMIWLVYIDNLFFVCFFIFNGVKWNNCCRLISQFLKSCQSTLGHFCLDSLCFIMLVIRIEFDDNARVNHLSFQWFLFLIFSLSLFLSLSTPLSTSLSTSLFHFLLVWLSSSEDIVTWWWAAFHATIRWVGLFIALYCYFPSNK